MEKMKDKTLLTTLGREPEKNFGIINPPVYHASTVLFSTVKDMRELNSKPRRFVRYGLSGTPTQFALEEALAKIEGGHDCALFPSGLAAISMALMAFVHSGDHILMVDSVYGPTRRFCDHWLSRMGVATTYYDPLIGGGIMDLIRPETKVVFTESPGSLTFEVQDIPAISAAAKEKGLVVMMDNTWATPWFFKPFEKGVDVSIQAGTKYIAGHSDVLLGSVTTTEAAWPLVHRAAQGFGQQAAPDDCYLALRGLRTMDIRLERQQATALTLARWLMDRPEVDRVLHPALPEDPGHEIWKRDFTGSSGLFGVILKPCASESLENMLDGYSLFGMGYSWGGFESLIIPVDMQLVRTTTAWEAAGPTLRIHAGLEDPEDLIGDLEAGFRRL